MSAPILSAYDWEMSQGFIRHLRAGFLDAVDNGKLQYRYVYPDGTVEWRDLVTGLTSVNFNFTGWWDLNMSQTHLLFVNGLSQIWEWSGGITTLLSTSTGNNGIGTVTEGMPPFGFFLPDAYGGRDYQIGDVLTLTSGDGNGTVVAMSVVDGGLDTTSVSINNIGSGYVAGDILAIIQDSTNKGGTIYVDSVDGMGKITGISLRSQGGGITGSGFQYTVGTNLVTVSGSGTGATVDINHVVDGVIQTIALQNGGSGYSISGANPTIGGHGIGALVQILSIATTSITKQGTTTWAQEGFYDIGTHEVTINGANYTATAGWDSTTLTGITPDPTGAGVAGDIIHQTPEITLNSAMQGIPMDFQNNLLESFTGAPQGGTPFKVVPAQLYVGSLISNEIYVSAAGDYKDYNASFPRISGDGITLITQAPVRAFIAQEDEMYVSAGLGQWYQVSIQTVSTVLASGSVINVITPTLNRLKTAGLQGAISQPFVSKSKNDVIFVSNEPIVNSLGRVDNVVLTPQMADLSFSIVNDMNKYDFTDGSIFFWQNYIFVAVPKEGLIRMYNMTKDTTTQNPTNDPIHYWEAPLTIPLSRFSVIDGDLYGHSYLVSETYKLFTGYNFNGHAIPAAAVFAYQQYGLRPQNKSENEYYVEGYISENATLDMTVNYDLDGTSGQYNGEIVGTDTQIVQIQGGQNSLGKESLGKNPLGGDLILNNDDVNKFRVIKTFPRTPYYEASPTFSSTGIDYIWSLIAFGPAQSPTSEGNNPISQ